MLNINNINLAYVIKIHIKTEWAYPKNIIMIKKFLIYRPKSSVKNLKHKMNM